MSRILIVDGTNLLVRAVHGMGRAGLSNADGVPTGPLMSFINTLTHHMREIRPDRIVVCWDNPLGSTRRKIIRPEYKANRKKAAQDDPERAAFKQRRSISTELAVGFLELAGIGQDRQCGFESDDLIAQYLRNIQAEGVDGHQVTILSSDKDFLMLLSDGPTVVDQIRLGSSGTDTDHWDAQRVVETYGCEPHQLRYAMALAGDASDGIQGVPRFGMKTALKYLAKYDWDFAVDLLADPKIAPYAGRAVENLALVDLLGTYETVPTANRLPPPFTRPAGQSYVDLAGFLQWLELHSIETWMENDRLWP